MNACHSRGNSWVIRVAIPALVATAIIGSGAEIASAAPRWRQEVDARVNRVLRNNPIPGAIVGIWKPGQRPYVHAFGVRSKATDKPMSPNLHMRLGSETKTFTATSVLQLVDDGKVGLDDPISTYVAGVPNGGNITIRQLLEMRSGLVSYTEVEAWSNQFLGNPEGGWKPEELLPYGYSQPPLFSPGTAFNYSNSNYVLLGLVVEAVTGEPFGDYVTREVLEAANLKNTFFPRGTEFPTPHAQGYTAQTLSGKVENSTNWNPSWAWAAGAMISKLSDLRRWARIVATGALLTPATQAQRTQFLPVGPGLVEYGLGLANFSGWIGHNGSLPGYESVTVYLPSQRRTMVILINSDQSPPRAELSTLLAQAITTVITPAHIYRVPAEPLQPLHPVKPKGQ